MDKHQKLSYVVAKLQQLSEFLKPYLPLANVHNTNFIVSDHWNTMIPEAIAHELLQLDEHELSLLPAGELYNCETAKAVANSSKCDVKDNCSFRNSEANCALNSEPDLITPHDLRPEHNSGNTKQVEEIAATSCSLTDASDSERKLNDKMTDVRTTLAVCHPTESDVKLDRLPEWDHLLVPDWRHQSLREFIMAAVCCTLPQLGLLTSSAELSHVLGVQSHGTQSHIVVSHAMKSKKSYEVDVMSKLCAWIAKGFDISTVSMGTLCTCTVFFSLSHF